MRGHDVRKPSCRASLSEFALGSNTHLLRGLSEHLTSALFSLVVEWAGSSCLLDF